MSEKDTPPAPKDKPAPTARPGRLRRVYVVLTPGGRVLGDRHHKTADAAADAQTAAAVQGVIVAGQVLADENE